MPPSLSHRCGTQRNHVETSCLGERENLHVNQNEKTEDTEQLGSLTFDIVFVNVAHVRCFMRSEIVYPIMRWMAVFFVVVSETWRGTIVALLKFCVFFLRRASRAVARYGQASSDACSFFVSFITSTKHGRAYVEKNKIS